MKKHYRQRIHLAEEGGAVMVIVALFVTVALGFMTLSIDEGSWLNRKSTNQNAVDSAAVQAATEIFQNGATDETAIHDSALNAAYLNGLSVDDDVELHVYGPGTRDNKGNIVPNDEVTVALTSVTDNYYAQSVTGRETTIVYADATAKASKVRGGKTPIANAAVEVGNMFNWNGASVSTVDGGITVGKTWNSVTPIVSHGSISVDGDFMSNGGQAMVVDGDLLVGGQTALSNITLNGGVYSIGGVNFNNTVKVSGDIVTNSIYDSTKSYAWNEYAGVMSSWATIVVDGTIYDNGGLKIDSEPWGPYNQGRYTNSKGNKAKVDSTVSSTRVHHTNFVWKWDCLNSTPDDSIKVTTDLMNAYIAKYPDHQYTQRFDGSNLTFFVGSDVDQFCQFCHTYAGKSSGTPIYIPGALTFNNNNAFTYSSTFVTEGDITCNTPMQATGDSIALISMHGNITLGNGSGQTFRGGIVVMDASKTLLMNGEGTIYGAVISHGNLTMTMHWDIHADTDWQANLPTEETGTKIVINLVK